MGKDGEKGIENFELRIKAYGVKMPQHMKKLQSFGKVLKDKQILTRKNSIKFKNAREK